MASAPFGAALQHIQRLYTEGSATGLSDSQLLERFHARRDQSAFALLVERHGPLVLATCRAMVHQREDAEDAFQATFLLLARKGNGLRDPSALGGWLHRVARRVACQANVEAERRRRRETQAGRMRSADPAPRAHNHNFDLDRLLHEELEQLPDRHRLPLVLCHLEELPHAQAARQLRWSERTLRRRLAEARERLRLRLERRGVAVPTTLLAAALAREATAKVPEPLGIAAVKGVTSGPAPAMTTAAALAGRILKSLALARLRLGAVAILAAGALASLAAEFAPGRLEPPQRVSRVVIRRPVPGPETPPQPQAVPPAQAPAKPDQGTITFAGRVLDPDGKPFAGASLFLIHPPLGGAEEAPRVRAVSGLDGRFRFAIPGAEVEAADGDRGWSGSQLLATATGFGPDWQAAARTGAGALELRLVKDIPLTGRVLGLEGRPVAGARVVVRAIATVKGGDLTAYVATVANGTEDGNGRLLDKRWEGRLPGQPAEVRTDADGRFLMAGFGGERLVELGIEGPAIESLTMLAMTRTAPDVGGPGEKSLGSGEGRLHGATFDLLVRPGRVITGVVRDKATRQPIAGMGVGMLGIGAQAVTGGDGRFTIAGFGKAEEYRLVAFSQGQPYFATCALVPDVAGLAPIEADIACVRGIPYRLRLLDQETGRPAIAAVNYWLLYPSAMAQEVPGFDAVDGIGALATAHREADGTYVGAVLSGPGAITIRPQDDRFAPACVDPRAFFKVGPEVPRKDFEGYGDPERLFVASGNSRSAIPQSQFAAIVLTNPAADSDPLSFEVRLKLRQEKP